MGSETRPGRSGKNCPLPARGHGYRARLVSRAGRSEALLRLSWHPPLQPYRADNGRQQDGAGGHQSHQDPARHGSGTLPATAVSKHPATTGRQRWPALRALFEVVVIPVRALRAVRVADRQHPVRSPAAPTRAVNAVVLLVSRWPPDQLTRGWLSLAGVREAGPQPGSGRPAANDQFSPGSRRARRRLRVLPAATLRGCSGPSAEPLSAC